MGFPIHALLSIPMTKVTAITRTSPRIQANTVLSVASEVAVPRVRSRVGSSTCVRDLVESFSRNSATTQAPDRPQTCTSFAGLESFDEVRRGFEFGQNRSVFYPPVSLFHKHNNHDSTPLQPYPGTRKVQKSCG